MGCLHAYINCKIDAGELGVKAMQLLNLCEAWLSTYLPHCLQVISKPWGVIYL